MTKKELEEYILSIGLDTFGFIPLREFSELRTYFKNRQEKKLQNEFEEKDIEKRIHPSIYMEDGKTILSIAFPYHQKEPMKQNGFSIYTKGPDYHRVVRSYLDQICNFLHDHGYQASAFVDSNTLPERYIAYLAGVGFIGRNNMIITKRYGSFVFLGEIITNMPIECEDVRHINEIKKYVECNECRLCYQECPTKSINDYRVNPNICLSYFTQKKELTDQEMNLIQENVFGCDYCQLKCPYNQMAMGVGLKDFAPMEYMNEELEIYANMDNKYFKEKISGSSCGWRGKNVIRRNAIMQLAKQGKDVKKFLGDSAYINEYIERSRHLFVKEKSNKNDTQT